MTSATRVFALLLAALVTASALFAQDNVAAYKQEWDSTAARAEAAIESNAASTMVMETLRAELVAQREDAARLESEARDRVFPLEEQLDALGPPPGDGETEDADVAERRAELQDAIDAARAPMLIAQAEFRRADGLIKEIDALIRTRFSESLTRLGPSPLNPVAWPGTVTTIQRYALRLAEDTGQILSRDTSKTALKTKAPLALFIAFLGIWMLMGIRRGFSDLVKRALSFGEGQPALWLQALASLARLIVPAAGAFALIVAFRISGLEGAWSRPILDVMPLIALSIIVAIWLGRSVFGVEADMKSFLGTDEDAARAGLRVSVTLGLMLAFALLIDAVSAQGQFTSATEAVLFFPLILIAALALFRLAMLLKNRTSAEDHETETTVQSLGGLIWRVLLAIAIAAPLLAAIGYLQLARYLTFPTILTLGLLASLRVIYDFFRTLLDHFIELEGREARRDRLRLIPVFIGFVISAAALSVLALIWGARTSDLFETWRWVNEGVSIGESQFSLSDLLIFILVFAIGYTITRMLQKTVRNSVLPKTRIDTGGRAAILSGLGYAGIFLSALAAISATGLDLSSLAIVAGALSVGIGFGLQNIVSNFVSGIILLIERPIKEGDWIAAGTTEGIVRKISVRATLIDTFDRRAVIIPNTDLIAGSVTNYTSPDKTGRVRIPIGVAYGTDAERVKAVLLEIAEANSLTLKYPAPQVIFQGFGASSLDFELRLYLRDINEMLNIRSEINFEIARRFQEEGFEIPFNQNDVTLTNIDEVAEAVVKIVGAPRGQTQPEDTGESE